MLRLVEVGVQDKAQRLRFVKMPWVVYRGNPYWVPPIIHDDMHLLDREHHPFWTDSGKGRFWVAERDGKDVGRIAAIRNFPHEKRWKESAGFFGFFECAEQGAAGLEVTKMLHEAVREAVKGWGLTHYYGPANPSSNYAFGALIEGFDLTPRIMMTYNPSYYDGLMKEAGLAKAKDLLAWDLSPKSDFSRIRRIADRIESRHRVRIRDINMKNYKEEIAIIKSFYTDAWSDNWCSCEMSDGEFDAMAKEMLPIVDPDFVYIAEIEGQPVGFSLSLPDANPAVKEINGRLWPFGVPRLLFHTKVWPKLRGIRILTLGIRRKYWTLGIGTSFYIRSHDRVGAKGLTYGEASWILEDNNLMNHALEAMSGKVTRRYRVYRGEA